MKLINLLEVNKFGSDRPYRELLYDSPHLRVMAFNFEAGQELSVHSHLGDSDGALLILEGEAEFSTDTETLVRAGHLNIMPVTHPRGLKAKTRVRLLVIFAPTL